ncbi:FYVE, RhoGEF and PH domain-containing protein 4 [Biomphalaria glabrata]|nr:FYVE, RhoGEF and PH domain-containing protein 4 [Biomphalaria glabrata]
MERLRSIIKFALPAISEDSLKNVVQRLGNCGVEEEGDLKFIQEDDLVGILKPVQCRKLLAIFVNLEPFEKSLQDGVTASDKSHRPTDLNSQATKTLSSKSRNSETPVLEANPEIQNNETQLTAHNLPSQVSTTQDSMVYIYPTKETPKDNSEHVVAMSESKSLQETIESCPDQEVLSSCLRKQTEFVPKTTISKTEANEVRDYRKSVISVIFREAMTDNLEWSDTDSIEGSEDEDQIFEDHMTADTEALLPDSKATPFMLAAKLMMSEFSYLEKLELLYTNFYLELIKENLKNPFMEPDTITHIFSNIETIYLFHKTFLLPQLEDRVKNWYQDPKLSDILRKNVPFLRIYIDYIQNFPQAMNLLQSLQMKSTHFVEFVDKLMKYSKCDTVSLNDLLKVPTERLLSYVQLIKEYVSVFQKDSTEFFLANEALNLLLKVAHSSSEAMKNQESFLALLVLSNKLTGIPQDFITPTRKLIAEGPVMEVSTRDGETLRQLILFNDLILVCSHDYSTDKYAVWAYIDMNGIELKLLDYTFELSNEMIKIELNDKSSFGWIQIIDSAIKNYEARKLQRQSALNNISLQFYDESASSYLGKIRPVWVPDYVATTCMICRNKFTFVNRRHHCRSCGKLICKWCCKKAPIEYKQSKKRLVCDGCFLVISKNLHENQDESSSAVQISTPHSISHKSSFSSKLSSFLPASNRQSTKSAPNKASEVKSEFSVSETKTGTDAKSDGPELSSLEREVGELDKTVTRSNEHVDFEPTYENYVRPSALSMFQSENESKVTLLKPENTSKETEA